MIEITSEYLRKNRTGVTCGSEKKVSCLSQKIIINFIEEYFGGNIMVDIKDGLVFNISAKLINLTIDDNFIKKYFSKIEEEMVVEDVEVSEDDNETGLNDYEIEFEINVMDDITEEEKPNILSETFSALVGLYGGSLTGNVFTNHLEFKSV
jgi:hypothetical protein